MITKQLAEKIPLPKDPRRKRFAEGLEWAVLFLVGFLEEIWRWGVVRILVNLEGGEGGYGNLSWLHMIKVANEDVSGSNIWKGVYFMGWVWCCIESGVCIIGLHCLQKSVLTVRSLHGVASLLMA